MINPHQKMPHNEKDITHAVVLNPIIDTSVNFMFVNFNVTYSYLDERYLDSISRSDK